jgi:hypothetical protein
MKKFQRLWAAVRGAAPARRGRLPVSPRVLKS